MSNVKIVPVQNRREQKDFLRLPWKLYQNDPNWVPPITSDIRERVGFRSHPFYEKNAIQNFVAYRNGEVCGRIAAILNQGHIDHYDERIGFFGFFESVDDPKVAHALFDAACGWFAERDIHTLRGPTNPSLNYELGLLIQGFDLSPTFMMSYNPPYYAELIESYGFEKSQDLLSFWGHIDMLPKIQERYGSVSAQIKEHLDLTVRPLDRSRFMEEVHTFLSIYNRSLGNTWGFVPMSDAEIHHMAAGLRYLIVPELAIAAEHEGRVIGAAFGLPDYNPRIRAIKGRLFPTGFIRMLWKKQNIEKIRMISTNVLPEYQMQGVGLVLMDALVPQVMKTKIKEAEFSWVLESNSLSRGSLQKGGAKIDKVYRIYDKTF